MAVLTGAANSADSFGAFSAQQLIDTIQDTLVAGYESESYNFSVRYDFHPSAALKFDYTQEEAEYENLSFNPIQGVSVISKSTREPSLVRIGVDLVF